MLPSNDRLVVTYHVIDIGRFLISNKQRSQSGNDQTSLSTVISLLNIASRKLNVELVVFGGGGLVQPGYEYTASGWRLPIGLKVERYT